MNLLWCSDQRLDESAPPRQVVVERLVFYCRTTSASTVHAQKDVLPCLLC